MRRLQADLRDSGVVAFFALLVFAPFLGVQLGNGASGYGISLTPTPDLLAIAVGLTFVARFLLLQWQHFRPAPPARLTAAVGKSGRFIAPALLLFAVAMPLIPGLPNSYVDLGVLILTYAMLGWGLNIVVGLAGLLDLGYVAFYAVGAYSFGLLSSNFGFGFWECLPIAGILAACWGIFLGFPVLRLRGDYLAIVTLAFGEIIRLIITNWVSLTGGPNGIRKFRAPLCSA